MADRKCKTASFDLTDAHEAKLLRHAEAQGKFSRYVKRLIERDMSGVSAQVVVELPDDEDREAAGGFL